MLFSIQRLTAAALVALLTISGCTDQPRTTTSEAASSPAAATMTSSPEGLIARNPQRNAYFGDLHIHTKLSFDAYIFGTRSTPDTAYEYAKGGVLKHPAGFDMQMSRPLDFLGVTDHAMYMGMLPAMDDPATRPGKHPVAVDIQTAKTPQGRLAAFNQMLPYLRGQIEGEDDLLDADVVRSAWEVTVDAAERHNDPGKFTTFVGYEYTASGPERENLHRNVVFKDTAPDIPFSSMDSGNPEDLWNWLDEQRGDGVEGLAIPHNSNGSDGLMFELTQTDGSPMTADYAERRMRNEPLVEITQVKGTSDTHPLLSPNDEWADFELMEVKVATVIPSKPEGSYVREAYANGLMMQANEGFNPYKFGLIGSSDTHVGAGSFDEDNYWSKVGMVDATAQQRGSVPLDEPDADGNAQYAGSTGLASFETWGASGLAAVWAESNTRESIYEAFRRKETFATSGPRMRVRMFAGYGLDDNLLNAQGGIATLYANATAMGGDLLAQPDTAPKFFVAAARDAQSAPLQRVQIIKGWVADDTKHEQVFDVACSNDLTVDPETHRCPDNGANVDLSDCSITEGVGAAQLDAVWSDPAFEPSQHAYYYVRVLENPTCRWSTRDALRAGVAPRPDLHATIQERAWSSPIHVVPAS